MAPWHLSMKHYILMLNRNKKVVGGGRLYILRIWLSKAEGMGFGGVVDIH